MHVNRFDVCTATSTGCAVPGTEQEQQKRRTIEKRETKLGRIWNFRRERVSTNVNVYSRRPGSERSAIKTTPAAAPTTLNSNNVFYCVFLLPPLFLPIPGICFFPVILTFRLVFGVCSAVAKPTVGIGGEASPLPNVVLRANKSEKISVGGNDAKYGKCSMPVQFRSFRRFFATEETNRRTALSVNDK